MPEWQSTHLSSEMSASLISITVVNLLAASCTIFLNILVMIAVKKTPQLRTNSSILLACLAGTDLKTGAALIHRLTGGFESYSLYVLKFASWIFAVTSVVAFVQHLTLLSIDRYIAIKHPFKYLEMVTIRRLTVTVAFAWLVAAFLAVLTAFIYSRPSFHVLFSQFLYC